jgi:transcriptional regulator with XRE-family HTH domain
MPSPTLGAQILDRLAVLGWRQADLARVSGVSTSSVQRYCTDQALVWRPEIVSALATALGTELVICVPPLPRRRKRGRR